jgi:hypothetical protein
MSEVIDYPLFGAVLPVFPRDSVSWPLFFLKEFSHECLSQKQKKNAKEVSSTTKRVIFLYPADKNVCLFLIFLILNQTEIFPTDSTRRTKRVRLPEG